MPIMVRYFASLRDEIGRDHDQVQATGISNVEDLWHVIHAQRVIPAQTLVAVNLEYARFDTPVKDGDEVAFFPPVSGG